jgi:hypothetical protein
MATKPFTLTVVTQTGTGASALAQAASQMAAGTWAVFPMSGLTSPVWIANNNTYLDGCPIGQYDPFNDRLVFIGGEHPTGPSTYNEINGPLSTNTFSRDAIKPANMSDSDLPQPWHGYYHTAVDWSTGDLYHIFPTSNVLGGDRAVWYRAGGVGAWTRIADTPIPRSAAGGAGYSMAQVWHPGMFGGRGGLVQIGVNKIAIYNPLTNTWTMNASSFSMGTINTVGVYNRADQCIYCGGGNSNLSMYRIDVNGVVTQRANFPIATGSNFNSTQGPLYSSTGSNRMVVMSVTQQAIGQVIYEYNHVSDTWAQIGTYPFTYGAGYACFTVDSCGVLLFVYNVSSTTINSSAYIWKR